MIDDLSSRRPGLGGVGGPVFDPWRFQSVLVDVMASTKAPPVLNAQRQRWRWERLLEAARRSPVYRERIGNGTLPTPEDMPPVARAELMARFDDWVTDPALRLDELQAFVQDPSLVGQSWLGRYVVWESSGTSGQPGIFVQDHHAMSVYDALEAVRQPIPSRGWMGSFGRMGVPGLLDPTDRYALVSATGGHFASVVAFERLRRMNAWLAACSRTFSVLQPLNDLVAGLNDFQPTVLAGYPTAMALLAAEAAAGRLHVRPRFVMAGGESLGPAVRVAVQESFGAPIRDSYGTSEFLPMAWECAHGELHVNSDWVLMEPVDAWNQPVAQGEWSHHVLLTNLANHVQPLIRYELGDRISLPPDPCACGSTLPVMRVRGRSDDVFLVPAARRDGTVSLLPLALCTVLEEECGLFDFQLCQQDGGRLLLRIPQTGELAVEIVERCGLALQRFAQAQGAAPLEVLGEHGCLLPRGRSGKAFRIVTDAPD